MPPVIETDRLTKQFARYQGVRSWLRPDRRSAQVTAVDGVSLAVNEGELFALLGPNGAGKTTLVKMLCTLIWPTAGAARIGGFDLSDSIAIRRHIGLAVGDERSFYWRLTGRENLEFYAALHDLPPRDARRRIADVLEWMELADKADQRFSGYSSGQKQRLAIARAVLHRPRILFMDEPTRSLDPTTTTHLHRFITEELLGREGMTVLLTTHRLDEAHKLAHRIAIMHKGQVRACGTFHDIRAALQPQTRLRLRVRGLADSAAGPLAQGLGATWHTNGAGDLMLEIESADGEEMLAQAIRLIGERGGQVRHVEQHDLTLEEVFQRFTAS